MKSLPTDDTFARYETDVERNYRGDVGAHLPYGFRGTTGWRWITAEMP